MPDLLQLAPEEDPARDGSSPDGDLLTWAGLDVLAAWLGMLAAFTGRTLSRAGESSLAGKGEE